MGVPETKITRDMFEPADIDSGKSEEIARESVSYWRDAFRRLRTNKGAIVSAIIILLIVVMAIIGPYMNQWGYNDQSLLRSNLPPRVSWLSNIHWLPFDGTDSSGVSLYESRSIQHNFWFGTDDLGRDLWTRVWRGTQISLIIGVVAALVDLIIGVAYGGISGYFGGKTDSIMQRVIEVLIGIPNLVWVILLLIVLNSGVISIIIAIAMTGWIGQARLVRGQVLRLKESEYSLAAKALGGSHMRVVSKHLLPNTIGIVIIQTMFSVPSAIFFEAFLSFIGLGINPPEASLGSLINEGYKVLEIHPYQAIFPGILISLLLICFNLFADGLRDALDPKMKQ